MVNGKTLVAVNKKSNVSLSHDSILSSYYCIMLFANVKRTYVDYPNPKPLAVHKECKFAQGKVTEPKSEPNAKQFIQQALEHINEREVVLELLKKALLAVQNIKTN